MIPKITQERPNIAPKYWCGTCGHALPPPNGPENMPKPGAMEVLFHLWRAHRV